MSTAFPHVRKIVPLLLLACATFAAYAPALRNDFVWDDTALVLRDPLIRSWRLIPESFQHFLFLDATASDFYRPVQRLSYMLDYAVYAFQPAGYHLTSIACHGAAAIALYFLALELLAYLGVTERTRRFVAYFTTLAWAVHPLHTSAVAYVSGRADPLAAAFGFLGLLLGLHSLRAVGVARWSFLLGAGTALLLSCLSKEIGLIFPALWLAILLLQRKWKPMRPASIAVLFIFVSYFALRLPAEHFPPPPSKPPAPFLARPILIARAFAEYTGLIVFPARLQMERNVETQTNGFGNAGMTLAAWRELETLAGITLSAIFIFWLAHERRRDRAVFACLVLTVICYLPISGIVPLNATLAEHWLYLPSAFLFLAFGLTAARWWQSLRPLLRPLLIAAVTVWIFGCAGRTFWRTFDWKNQRTFLERTIASGAASARMLINLGGLEMSEGHLAPARKHLDAALQSEPEQPLAVLNRAALAVKENDFPRAHELLKRATEMPLVEAQAYELLAVLENKEFGRTNPMRLRLATRSGIPSWTIERRYVRLLAEIGSLEAAIAELKRCLLNQWYRAESWQLLAALEQEAGRPTEARAALQKANQFDVHLIPAAPQF